MMKNRLLSAFAIAGLVSLAACAGEDVDDGAVVEQDTIGIPTTTEVTVPAVDSAVVTTTTDTTIDVDVDTTDIDN